MSLRGRYVIDRVKQMMGKHWRLPVPPYGDPMYWDAAYQSFGPQDTIEWGQISIGDLHPSYNYKALGFGDDDNNNDNTTTTLLTSSLGEALKSHPLVPQEKEKGEDDDNNGDDDQEPILMLGCGNSTLGEDMIQAGWKGPMLQVDVSARVIDSMSQRCGPYIESGDMNFIQDDATELSAFPNQLIHACLDKGLLDAIYCAEEYDQCAAILKSVNRVLKPGGTFCFLSFSRPEFLLPHILLNNNKSAAPRGSSSSSSNANPLRESWEQIEVHELPTILLYKLQKTTPTTKTTKATPIQPPKNQQYKKRKKTRRQQ